MNVSTPTPIRLVPHDGPKGEEWAILEGDNDRDDPTSTGTLEQLREDFVEMLQSGLYVAADRRRN